MYQKEHPQSIKALFNSIAQRYDLTNVVLSFALCKYWNRLMVRQVRSAHQSQVLVDLCAGTGDIAFSYLKAASFPCQAYLVDFSSEMLKHAKNKAAKLDFNSHTLNYLEADVQQIPLADHLADCATMAYGIRNVQQPTRCLQEVWRILKPGGQFALLELTRPQQRFLRMGHHLYLKTCLPLLGKWLTANEQAYQYLCQSIHTFIPPEELESLLKAQGFIHTKRQALAGGIATLLVGQKPLDS